MAHRGRERLRLVWGLLFMAAEMTRVRHRRSRLIVVALAAVAGGLVAYRALRPEVVTVEPVIRGRAVEAIYATGTVEPIARVKVKARVSEHVAQVAVREADRVRPGQLLARIESPVRQSALSRGERELAKARVQAGGRSPQLASLEAQARALGSQLALAKLELARAETLAATSAIPRQELDAASARTAQLQAQADAAVHALRSQRLELGATRDQLATEVRSLASEADEAAVIAPIAGLVLRRDVEPGEVVSLDQTLFEIADDRTLLVELAVDEADIGRVRDGDRGSPVALSFYAFPGKAFGGTVLQILPDPDRVRRAYTVKVRLDAPIPGLRIGMTAEANVILQQKDRVLLIPIQALEGARAWFVEGGRATLRDVTIGIRDLTRAEVVAGASEGALAIVDGTARGLRPGDRVRARARAEP